MAVSKKAKITTELLSGLSPMGWMKEVGDALRKIQGKEPNAKCTQSNFQLIKSNALGILISMCEGD